MSAILEWALFSLYTTNYKIGRIIFLGLGATKDAHKIFLRKIGSIGSFCTRRASPFLS